MAYSSASRIPGRRSDDIRRMDRMEGSILFSPKRRADIRRLRFHGAIRKIRSKGHIVYTYGILGISSATATGGIATLLGRGRW